MGGLTNAEQAVRSAQRNFFSNLEATETSRSYKLVLLLAMLDSSEKLIPSLTIDELAHRVAEIAKRMHGLAEDFSVDLSNLAALKRLLINNPIEAFVHARGMGGVRYFTFDSRTFAFAFDIPDRAAFGVLIREILDWRLAQYLARGKAPDVICSVSRNSSGSPILFLPSGNASGSLPKGPLDILVEGRPMQAIVAKIAVNVVRAPGGENELASILHKWFGRPRGRHDAEPVHCERGCRKARSAQDRGLLFQTGGSRGFCRLRSPDAQAWRRSSQGRR